MSLSATLAKVLCLLLVYLVHSSEFLYQLTSKLIQMHIYIEVHVPCITSRYKTIVQY